VCNPLDLTCAATQVAASAFDSIVESAGKAAAEMIGNALTFWVGTDTVNPDSPAVQNLQQYTVPISAVILTGSVMVQGIRMMLSRKKDPLIAVAVD
jgi:type IV secretion system protein TrbL